MHGVTSLVMGCDLARTKSVSHIWVPQQHRNGSRLGTLNDEARIRTLASATASVLGSAPAGKDSVCLSVSDGSLPALLAVDAGATDVYSGMKSMAGSI